MSEAGLNLIIHNADLIAMREKLGAEVRDLRERLGDRIHIDVIADSI